ncbi:hypothetical protein GJAV_G00198410 [Gymnothorax javanicus]|nr:hypothetical protein GJAV_G00198410 [Gymnothorax javanicus]
METLQEAAAWLSVSERKEASITEAVRQDPRRGLKRYLLLKYLQVLVLPQGNEVLVALGALASLYTVVLLRSPTVSRKASTVLLGQLAWADGLVVARWCLGALRCAVEDRGALAGLEVGFLSSSHNASLLFLSCVSLEALLVTWRPVETRRIRTVHAARLASALVWLAVVTELLVLRAADHSWDLQPQDPLLWTLLWGSLVFATSLRLFFLCLRGVMWLVNVWVCYTLFFYTPQRRKSCFH